ncbi:Uncharacterized protein AArcCO_1741 [Halalkaliarchaeum sp. AArc-CO]|uniref:hypothetical protein n=1 Tax=unclassified Halalkaliarchaeum TaxID=2678344 RepID=UPI00217E76ED|nr:MULTISPECIES: hypothetical protein [unclassified Halalkaliarchaeum]MDR5671540.1 hypothetical protein [Halalkaliarchaeum sp. AArc-GB]UWG51040.1 Uncharacterized protein AArcCO_1741 [Halalkaliarchaeum sp. AArc-CO]
MTRFSADTPTERRKLFADAVVAHRQRASPFLTVETPKTDDEEIAPWIQLSEHTLNMDCTDAELQRLKSMLDEYQEFRIDELESPENADGTNVRITARSDANRLAEFMDRAFREVYRRAESYTAWAVEV